MAGSKKSNNSILKQFLFPLVLIALVPVIISSIFIVRNGESFLHVVPYSLMFTGFRELNILSWDIFGTPLNMNKKFGPQLVPIMDAKDYTYEKFGELTENWSRPAVVRGLFKDTPGVANWGKMGYLKSKIGGYEIPVIRNAQYGNAQNNKTKEYLSSALDDVLTEDKQKSYLFFPMKSRLKKSDNQTNYHELVAAVDNLMIDDLEVNKLIWNGFGTKIHKTYVGGQMIIGKGRADTAKTTGTGWHCAMGSNFFVQVVGKKRWYFMAPKYSYMFKPLRNSVVAFMISFVQPGFEFFPLEYVDVEAGDMLYNPDFQWHTIMNYEGLSIGCPIREFNLSYSIRNNILFSGVALINKGLEAFDMSLGGFMPDASKQFD